MRRNLLVHQRLRERRLVAFVVPVTPVADQIDQEVALESAAVFPREPCSFEAGRWIVGIDVHDRDLEPAGESARVAGAVGLVGRCREAELIVRDDVNRSTGVVAVEAGKIERLRDDALTGKRGVAMDQHRQRRGTAETRRAALVGVRARGARHSHDHRIHRLQMARVGGHRHERMAARARRPRARVVLHVSHPSEVHAKPLGENRILELGEDLRVRLLEDVREHVQPAAVRHADDRVASSRVGRSRDDLVEHGHEHVEPFERETRLAGEGPLQESLEHFDLRDPIEERFGARRIERWQKAAGLGRVSQPVALLGHEDVRVVEAG